MDRPISDRPGELNAGPVTRVTSLPPFWNSSDAMVEEANGEAAEEDAARLLHAGPIGGSTWCTVHGGHEKERHRYLT
jgi:hypothetical protein